MTVSDGAPRAPLAIVDGGAGPDRIEVLRSDSGFGAAPATLVQNMAGPGDELTVNSNLGLVAGDLSLARFASFGATIREASRLCANSSF